MSWLKDLKSHEWGGTEALLFDLPWVAVFVRAVNQVNFYSVLEFKIELFKIQKFAKMCAEIGAWARSEPAMFLRTNVQNFLPFSRLFFVLETIDSKEPFDETCFKVPKNVNPSSFFAFFFRCGPDFWNLAKLMRQVLRVTRIFLCR